MANVIKSINKCIKLTKTNKLSENKYYTQFIKKLSRTTSNFAMEILFEDKDNLLMEGGGAIYDKSFDDFYLINELYSKTFNSNVF